MKYQYLLTLTSKGDDKLECIFQDPQFTDLDRQFLTSLGYTVVHDPEAIGKITVNTLVYAIHCYADVYMAVSEGPHPSVMVITDVENFGRFNVYVKHIPPRTTTLTEL